MCWLPLSLGVVMMIVGTVLIVRFFAGRAANSPDVATATRTETMIIGALLASLGLLLTSFGATGAICQGLGLW